MRAELSKADQLGRSIAIHEGLAVIGAPGEENSQER